MINMCKDLRKNTYIINRWGKTQQRKRKLDTEYSRVSRTKKYILNEKMTGQT